MTQGVQLRQGVIQTDGKQQEHHTELCQRIEIRQVDIAPKGMRAKNDAHQQIAEAGRDMQSLESNDDRHRRSQQHQDMCKLLKHWSKDSETIFTSFGHQLG